MINIDYMCMEYSQNIAFSLVHQNNDKEGKKPEGDLRKALGILQEDGVYAMFLWLEENNNSLRKQLSDFTLDMKKKLNLKNDDTTNNLSSDIENFSNFCKELEPFAENIDNLFLLKRSLDRTLVYVLYQVRGQRKDE